MTKRACGILTGLQGKIWIGYDTQKHLTKWDVYLLVNASNL